jgi:hypothetical protein
VERTVFSHGDGEVTPQQLDFYESAQTLYLPKAKEGAFLEMRLAVSKPEPLRLLLNMTQSYDFGIYQPYLDGVKVGEPLDFYSPEIRNQEYHLLDFWPEAGSHTLRLECVGKNAASTGHYAGLESVRLRERRPRVAQYAHDKAKDWKKEQILYR